MCEHKVKVRNPMVMMTDPPQQTWICANPECLETGTEIMESPSRYGFEDLMRLKAQKEKPKDPEVVWHYLKLPGVILCGCDSKNQRATDVFNRVNCTQCVHIMAERLLHAIGKPSAPPKDPAEEYAKKFYTPDPMYFPAIVSAFRAGQLHGQTAERERCAKIIEAEPGKYRTYKDVAAEIRKGDA